MAGGRGDPWIPVGDLARGFEPDADVLPPTADLVGRAMALHLADGSVIEYRFDSDEVLTWAETTTARSVDVPGADGSSPGHAIREAYRAVKIREGIYFVDHLRHGERATSVSLLLDMARAICTCVNGRLPTRQEAEAALLRRNGQGLELTAVAVTFVSGAIDCALTEETERHQVTSDLIGRRVEYTYSPTEQYEHIYLNEHLYTWHCLRGVEKGLADTDRCHYYRLDDRLYLFVWREKLVPTLGVVVTDYAAGRSTGKIFGYEGADFEGLSNFPVGAAGRVLNITRGGQGAALDREATPLRVAIMGAGALGATFGFLLAEAGADVTLIDVDVGRVAAIDRDGLTLVMPDGSRRTRRLTARDDPAGVGAVDLVQISVKGYHTRSAAELCLPMLGPRTYVLSLQNGLLNLERIAEVVGAERVLGGVTAHSAMPLGPTTIRYNGGMGGVDFGRLDGTADPDLQRIAALFEAAGLSPHLIKGAVHAPIWRKLLANTSTNPVAAVTGMTGAQLRDCEPASTMIRALAEETAGVARARGLEFEELQAAGDFVIRTLDWVGDNKVSMLQDIEAGRRTEVENLSLAVVAEGEQMGVGTPLNWCMGMLIMALQQRPLLETASAGSDGAGRRADPDVPDYYRVV